MAACAAAARDDLVEDEHAVGADGAVTSQNGGGAGAVAGGNHGVREDGGQRAEDGVGNALLAVNLRADGAGLGGVHDAALGGDDLDGPVDALVGGDVVAHQGFHREEHRCLGAGIRHVDGGLDLARGAGEVEGQIVALDGHLDLDGQGIGVLVAAAVHIVGKAVLTVGQAGHHRAHAAFGVAHQLLHAVDEGVVVAGVGLLNALHADQVGRHLRGQVALALLGNAGVVQQQIHDAGNDLAVLPDADHGNAGALLEQAVGVAGGGTGHLAADVGVMGDVGDPANQFFTHKGGGRDHDVVGVVGDEHIAGFDVFTAELLVDAGHHAQHTAQQGGQAFHLGHAVAVRVDHGGADVPPLLHVGGVGAAHDDAVGLLRNGHEQVANHLNGDGINFLCHLSSPHP